MQSGKYLPMFLRNLLIPFLPRRPGFEPRSGHVWFVVDKVALGQVFSEYFGFSCQFSFHRLLHTHYHLSSGAGTIGQLVADVPSGLSLTTPQEIKKTCTTEKSGQWYKDMNQWEPCKPNGEGAGLTDRHESKMHIGQK
jgi:hypothetical protein